MAAKKRALKAAAMPEVPVEFNLKMDISKEDIVSIGVSEYEDQLREHMTELTKERKSLVESIEANQIAIDKACLKAARDTYNTKLAAIEKALAAVDVDVDPWVCSAVIKDMTIRRKKAQRIVPAFSLDEDDARGWNSLPHFAVPAAIKKMLEKDKALNEELKEVGSEIAQTHSDIADIPTYIRRVRAEVARRAMESTAEGRALLGTVMGAPKQARLNG